MTFLVHFPCLSYTLMSFILSLTVIFQQLQELGYCIELWEYVPGEGRPPGRLCRGRAPVGARACSSAEKKGKKIARWSRVPTGIEGERGKVGGQQK